MQHLQKYYFGFWLLLAWKLNLESSDIGLTNIVFAWQCISFFSRGFCFCFLMFCMLLVRICKSKEVVFPRNKRFCIGGRAWGSFLSIQMLTEKGEIVTKIELSFPSVPWQSALGPLQAGSPVQGFLSWQSSGIFLKASKPGSVCFLKSLFVS